MATQTCWRCLTRLTFCPSSSPRFTLSGPPPPPTPLTLSHSFSTTTPLHENRPAKKTLRLARQKRMERTRVPAPGERKALRQRVVLSNTNALAVTGMKDWSAATCAKEELIGRVIGLPGEVVDGLRAVGAFKPSQGWGLFRRPASLIRRETVEMAREFVRVKENGDTIRRLVVGGRGVGKSVWLLQAQSVAFMKGWVVVHFPEARDVTNATSSYAPIPNTNPVQYSQPGYTAALLSRIARANDSILSKVTLSLQHDTLPIQLRPDTTLLQLAETGAADRTLAWPIFQALWSELTLDNNSTTARKDKRPPIMLSMDGLAHASRQSLYMAPNMHHIHAYDLALVSHFISYLSGSSSLPNGGAIAAADSGSNRPLTSTLDLAIRQSEERTAALASDSMQEMGEQPLQDPQAPFERVDERVLKALRGVPVVRLGGFTKEETRSALEYYARSGMLRARVTQGLVGERWALSGGGVVGQLEKASVSSGIL